MYEIVLSKNPKSIILSAVLLTGPSGAWSASLILDTGAGYSMISKNMAVVLGYEPESQKQVPIITGNGVIFAPIVILKKVSVGDISATNIVAICHDVPELTESEGLLGLNFLSQVRTLLDFRALRLTID